MRLWPYACAIAIGWAARAHADGTGIAAASASRADRGAVAEAMATAIGEAKPARLLVDAVGQARGGHAAGAVPIGELARFRSVRDKIGEGWASYLRVSFEFAQARLAAARTEAEELITLPGGAELYADASLRLGIVLGRLGQTEEAQSAIALALALDPERPITNFEFSPDALTAVDAVRGLTRKTREVEITSAPAGATISVDGRELGRAPISASLAIGQHVIVARSPGALAHAEAVAVAEGTAQIAMALDADVTAGVLAQGPRPGLDDAAAQLLVDSALQLADLDELVLVVASDRRGGEALLVQRCAGAPARCTAVVEIGYGEPGGLAAAASSAWQAVRTAALRYPPTVLGDPRVAGERVVHRCEWCRSPWVWGSAGAAALVGTIAIIAIATSSRPSPTVVLDPGGFLGH